MCGAERSTAAQNARRLTTYGWLFLWMVSDGRTQTHTTRRRTLNTHYKKTTDLAVNDRSSACLIVIEDCLCSLDRLTASHHVSALTHTLPPAEQQIPAESEIDDIDASCIHFVCFVNEGNNEKEVGTCRIIPDYDVSKRAGKLGRFAVLKEYR